MNPEDLQIDEWYYYLEPRHKYLVRYTGMSGDMTHSFDVFSGKSPDNPGTQKDAISLSDASLSFLQNVDL